MKSNWTRVSGVLVGFCMVGLVAARAAAYELENVRIASWTGDGVHAVVLVVDFWPYNGAEDSFAFGYRFDEPAITGLQLLEALHAADNGLTFAHVDGFVTDFWYQTGGVVYHTSYAWPESYWSYWVSEDWGETWGYAMEGAADRILSHGDTDGWLALPGDDYESVPVTPLLPAFIRGDMNCDGAVDFDDIDPWIVALGSEAAYQDAYPDCVYLHGDCDADGDVDFDDIDAFVALLDAR